MTPPLVSIVVLSWNTRDETALCLSHLRRLDYPQKELIVIDNGSTDGSKEYLEATGDIVYISLEDNRGFTGGQLTALAVAQGDYLALVNSDAVVAPDWLTACMSVMFHNPSASAVGGRAFRWASNEDLFSTSVPFWSYQTIDLRTGGATTATSGRQRRTVDSISGAAVVIRRSAVITTGYFDHDFFAYYEETDLFARMQRCGYSIWYEPRAHVWHQVRGGARDNDAFYHYQMQRNRCLFALKNLPKPWRFVFSYVKDAAWAALLLAGNRRDTWARAVVRAFWWNTRHLLRTLQKRQAIMALGEFESFPSHHLPSDITVVIPCHNYAKYVGEAIESVLGQTHEPTRIVVINDGSTDASIEVIRKYEGRVEIIDKENEGVVPTKNAGLALSDTTWTVFLDADDLLPPEYLESAYRGAVRVGADVVYTGVRKFGAVNAVEQAPEYSAVRLADINFIHNSALIATEMARRVGGYKREMALGYEDWELYMSLAEAGASFAAVDGPLLLYRQHEAASRNQMSHVEAVRLWRMARAFHPRLATRSALSLEMAKHAIRTLIKNPELVVIAPIILLGAVLAGVPEFLYSTAARCAGVIHRYLHAKNANRVSADQGPSDAFPSDQGQSRAGEQDAVDGGPRPAAGGPADSLP